jgi:hypothetical protein
MVEGHVWPPENIIHAAQKGLMPPMLKRIMSKHEQLF